VEWALAGPHPRLSFLPLPADAAGTAGTMATPTAIATARQLFLIIAHPPGQRPSAWSDGRIAGWCFSTPDELARRAQSAGRRTPCMEELAQHPELPALRQNPTRHAAFDVVVHLVHHRPERSAVGRVQVAAAQPGLKQLHPRHHAVLIGGQVRDHFVDRLCHGAVSSLWWRGDARQRPGSEAWAVVRPVAGVDSGASIPQGRTAERVLSGIGTHTVINSPRVRAALRALGL
jgi:hypothetical protein